MNTRDRFEEYRKRQEERKDRFAGGLDEYRYDDEYLYYTSEFGEAKVRWEDLDKLNDVWNMLMKYINNIKVGDIIGNGKFLSKTDVAKVTRVNRGKDGRIRSFSVVDSNGFKTKIEPRDIRWRGWRAQDIKEMVVSMTRIFVFIPGNVKELNELLKDMEAI